MLLQDALGALGFAGVADGAPVLDEVDVERIV